MVGPGMIVARVAGVGVRVRAGAIVLFAAIAALLATQLLPAVAPGTGPILAWVVGLWGAVLFEVGLVLHEVGHAILARRAGLRAEVVDLQLFGGVTEVEGEVSSPRDQAQIAAVGPAISLGYAVAVGLLTLAISVAGASVLVVAVGIYVAVASAAVGMLNLLPGAPLDGGRILQAWLWYRHGDPHRAALTAAGAGRLVSALLIVVGIALAVTHLLSVLGGLSVVAMGAFAWLGARDERQQLAAVSEPEPEPAPQART